MNDAELLDLFAMVALHAHLTNPNVKNIPYSELAEISYDIAEAMMNEKKV